MAVYMTDRGSPSKDAFSRSLDLRQMTDDQISMLESFIRAEKMRRKQEVIDSQAVDMRRGLRRSKSGGSEAAFSRKSPGSGLDRKGSGDLNTSFGLLKVSQEGTGLEQEDPEVRSAFSAQVVEPAVPTISTPSNHQSPSYAVRALSRGSGAIHPGEKMFERTSVVVVGTPSPATTNAAGSSHASTAILFLNSPTQNIQSPVQDHGHSRPNSRPSTEVHHGELSAHSSSFRNTDHPQQAAPSIKKPSPNFSSIEGDELTDDVQQKNKKLALTRELVLSPSCAFDDISLGSQRSFNSSRSSRTRVLGENGLDLPSPTSTFSKHHHAAVKKTIQSLSAEQPRKSKKV